MRIQDLVEQIGTVGSTGTPIAGATIPPTSAPAATIGGNVPDVTDPKVQAAQLAQNQKQKQQAKQSIMAQIAALNKQLSDLNRTA